MLQKSAPRYSLIAYLRFHIMFFFSAEQCTCRTRLALFHLTINDLYLLEQLFIENMRI